jgi:hypothetical protein
MCVYGRMRESVGGHVSLYKTFFSLVNVSLGRIGVDSTNAIYRAVVWRVLRLRRTVAGCSRFGEWPVQCSAVQCSAVQCSAMQCSAVQCSAVQCSAVQ